MLARVFTTDFIQTMQPLPRDRRAGRIAVILAAGRGQRMGPAGDVPKGLLRCGGQPLLAHSLDALSQAGTGEALIVTGYRADLIERELGTERAGIRLHYLVNPDYETSGSMGSLAAAVPRLAGRDCLLLESDLLYDPRFVQAAAAANDDVIFAADVTGSGDEVFLSAGDDDRLQFLGKSPPAEWRSRCHAEFAGISRLSAPLLAAFGERARIWGGRTEHDRHYEEVLFELAQEGWPIRIHHCPGLAWTEVDTSVDFERALRVVWPRLAPMRRRTPG